MLVKPFYEFTTGSAAEAGLTVRFVGSIPTRIHVAVLDTTPSPTDRSEYVVMTSPDNEHFSWDSVNGRERRDPVVGDDGVERRQLHTANGSPLLLPVLPEEGPVFLRGEEVIPYTPETA